MDMTTGGHISAGEDADTADPAGQSDHLPISTHAAVAVSVALAMAARVDNMEATPGGLTDPLPADMAPLRAEFSTSRMW